MVDRDLYRADGGEWFEPRQDDLEETKEEMVVREGGSFLRCDWCNREIEAGDQYQLTYIRSREWQPTGGISGQFGSWSDWRVSEIKCDTCAGLAQIPF